MPQYELIKSAAELSSVCEELSQEPVVAVDTEFFWESTFYPILGVVQLATAGGKCFLLDAVTLKSLHPLASLLQTRSVTKILHDAPQDLAILAKAAGASPVNIFDTKTAAGFAGFECTCSLQKLLKQVLDVDLPKAETRSNWIKRPLSENQLKYAVDDVLYLPELRNRLISACREETVLLWMMEENASLDAPSICRERDPAEMFTRVKGSARLDRRGLAVLRELAAWREKKARNRNLPRNRIMPDAALVEIAYRQPESRNALELTPGYPRKIPSSVTAEITAALRRGLLCPEDECPETAISSTAGYKELKTHTKELLQKISRECEKYGVDPALVASRSDAESYLLHQAGSAHPLTPKLCQGWRAELMRAITARP